MEKRPAEPALLRKVGYMAICFIDTEFTDLSRPQLLSLGMVSKDGDEFYVELDLQSGEGRQASKSSTDLVHRVVLPQWEMIEGATDSHWGMGRRAAEWLIEQSATHGGRIEVAYDYDADFELLAGAIHNAGLWEQIQLLVRPINIDRLTGTIEAELAAESAFESLVERALFQHHALADAVALRAAYSAAVGAAKGFRA